MKKYFLTLIIIPFLMFANTSEEYAELFLDSLANTETEKCYEILDEWDSNFYEDYSFIRVLKAAVLLCEGNLNESSYMMNSVLPFIDGISISHEQANLIRYLYKKAGEFNDLESLYESRSGRFHIELCRDRSKTKGRKQPTKLKLKFLVGIAKIIGGVATAPLTTGGSLLVALDGALIVIESFSDCHENIEMWEREFDDQQRLDLYTRSF